jgi:predicted transcriptional regulator
LVSEAEVTRSMVSDLTNRVFDGDAAALVSHLLAEHEIDASELAHLIDLVGERGDEEEEPA